MADPFATLKPLINTAEVRYSKTNATLDLWRQANIALPDLHIIDHNQVPPVLGEDGEVMTFERRQELMKGRKPLFETANPEDHTQAKLVDVDFIKQFDDAITSEQLGASAVACRPQGLRVIPPREWTPPVEPPPEPTPPPVFVPPQEPTMNISDPNIWAPMDRAGAVVATIDKHGRIAMWFGPVYLHSVSGQYVPTVQHPKEPIVLGLAPKGAEQGVMVFNPAMPVAQQQQLRLMCVGPTMQRSFVGASNEDVAGIAKAVADTVQAAEQAGPVQR